jgi:hypothetical protein
MVSPKINHKEVSMETIYYIGLDIHKKVIAYCIKTKEGAILLSRAKSMQTGHR